jgi:hypothetical protein
VKYSGEAIISLLYSVFKIIFLLEP